MPLVEIVATVFGMALAVSGLFRRHTAAWFKICLAGLLLSLFLQLLLIGPHWQLLPLYFLGMFATAAAIRWTRSTRAAIYFTTLSLLLVASTATFSYLLPMFSLPAPTGAYAVGTRIFHFIDRNRLDTGARLPSGHRELMVQAWYPIDAAQAHGRRATYRRLREVTLLSSYMAALQTNSYRDRPISQEANTYSVILFNPAWKGQRTQSEYLMEELASYGFVVLSIDHTYNSGPVAFPGGPRIVSSAVQDIDDFTQRDLAAQQAQGNAEVRLEAQDDIFVLDELTRRNTADSDPWFRHLDLAQVGAMGHSFGGAVALQAAYSDPRIAAAINMDGWTFGDPEHLALHKPAMQMNEDIVWPSPDSIENLPREHRIYWQLTFEDARAVESSLLVSGGYRVAIRNAKHMDFSDRPLYSPIKSWTSAGHVATKNAHEIVRRFAVAFFSTTLRGKTDPLLLEKQPFSSEVTFRVYPSNNCATWNNFNERTSGDTATAAIVSTEGEMSCKTQFLVKPAF